LPEPAKKMASKLPICRGVWSFTLGIFAAGPSAG
jgi:hypothetical protein